MPLRSRYAKPCGFGSTSKAGGTSTPNWTDTDHHDFGETGEEN